MGTTSGSRARPPTLREHPQEAAMNHNHPLTRRRSARILAGIAAAATGFAATTRAALAEPWPQYVSPHPHLPPLTRTIIMGGTPGWQIVLLMLTAAFVAAAAAVSLDRARQRRLQQAAAEAVPAAAERSGDSDLPVVTVRPGRW
jgi:hypothetical protein